MKTLLARLRNKNPRAYELAAYLFFGMLTTLVNWLVYEALKLALGLSQYEQGSSQYTLIANVCQAAGWVISVLFAYFTNRVFVFRSKTKKGGFFREIWQFISSRALGYVLFDLLLFNVFLLFMADRPAKLIMNGFVIVFNYLASRFVVFRHNTIKANQGTQQED